MLGIDVDGPEGTIVLLISTSDVHNRHDNDLLTLLEIIYLLAVPTPTRVKYGAVHGVPPKETIVCIIMHTYDAVRDAAPEIVVVRRVPPEQVVVHHAAKQVVVCGVTSAWYFIIDYFILYIIKYAM